MVHHPGLGCGRGCWCWWQRWKRRRRVRVSSRDAEREKIDPSNSQTVKATAIQCLSAATDWRKLFSLRQTMYDVYYWCIHALFFLYIYINHWLIGVHPAGFSDQWYAKKSDYWLIEWFNQGLYFVRAVFWLINSFNSWRAFRTR